MKKFMQRSTVAICMVTMAACTSKSNENKIPDQAAKTAANKAAQQESPTAATGAAGNQGNNANLSLLLAQAQFQWQVVNGKKRPKPGPAKLMILTRGGAQSELWGVKTLEDPDSIVFHKAVCRQDDNGSPTLWTIGATDAHFKSWRLNDQGDFVGQSHWQPTFGGKWDRLRDFEVADTNGDGQEEAIIATHDQGVIAVIDLTKTMDTDNKKAAVQKIHAAKNTFVHEIEVGKLAASDAYPWIVATPSKPNKAGQSQAGGILALQFDGKKYRKEWVAQFKGSHAKEVLMADVDGDGFEELYGVIEAKLRKRGNKSQEIEPVKIVRYERKAANKWQGTTVAELPGAVQSRVLLATDLDGDGNNELVTTTMKDGIWRLAPPTPASKKQQWVKTQIDSDSTGFEHAALAHDSDGDGKAELYVAADDQDEIRRYVWDGQKYAREVIGKMDKSDITWNITPCTIPGY